MNIAQENTVRALREEVLFVTFWGCRFGIHRWLKYSDPVHIKEGYYDFLVQKRACGCCNYADQRTIKKW